MMADVRDGLAKVVAQAVSEADVIAPMQPSLFPADQMGELPADLAGRAAELRAPRRGPGRPAGAINRKTEDVRRLLASRGYADPLLFMAEVISRSVRDLAIEVGCDGLEAIKLQVACARELAPYLHGKMPVSIEVSGALPVLQLIDPRAMLESEQIQGVSNPLDLIVGSQELEEAKLSEQYQSVEVSEPLIANQPVDGAEHE